MRRVVKNKLVLDTTDVARIVKEEIARREGVPVEDIRLAFRFEPAGTGAFSSKVPAAYAEVTLPNDNADINY